MTQQHTPGPWMPHIAFVDGEGYSTLFVKQGIQATKEDMRLIVAAPDLLEALEAARGYVEGAAITSGANTAKRVLQGVEAAIAKARGEA